MTRFNVLHCDERAVPTTANRRKKPGALALTLAQLAQELV